MYFIEKIIKLFYKKSAKNNKYKPLEIENCSHTFFPIDSSGEILACSKCGKIIKREK